MSVLDWQTAIRMRIENTEGIYPAAYDLYYKFPRAVGVSTFLADVANYYDDLGFSVLFVSYPTTFKTLNKNVMVWPQGSIQGKTVDYIIIDSLRNTDVEFDFYMNVFPTIMSSDKTSILRIDSVDF